MCGLEYLQAGSLRETSIESWLGTGIVHHLASEEASAGCSIVFGDSRVAHLAGDALAISRLAVP